MIVSESVDLSPEESQGMVNTFLWHAIGEDFVMTRHIQGEVVFDDNPIGPTVSADEVVSMVGNELE